MPLTASNPTPIYNVTTSSEYLPLVREAVANGTLVSLVEALLDHLGQLEEAKACTT